MYKFIYAKHKIHPKLDKYHEQWYCLIDDADTLFKFVKMRAKQLSEAYMYVKRKRNIEKIRGHFTDYTHIMVEQLLILDPNRKNLLDDCACLDKITDAYIHCFIRWGAIVISPNYSFRNIDDTFDIQKEIKQKEFIFPLTNALEIKVSRWPGGKHYYAKVGNIDVKDEDGNIKWGTYKRAEIEAKKFLTNQQSPTTEDEG